VSLTRLMPVHVSLSVRGATGAQCQDRNLVGLYAVSGKYPWRIGLRAVHLSAADSMWLRSVVPVHCVEKILPEPLAYNLHVGHTLAHILRHETRASLTLESMYAQHGLDRAHAMCLPCLQQFVGTCIFAWCREQLVTRESVWFICRAPLTTAGGVEIPDEDCAEGGHCDAQTELEAHAREMNHLCDAKDGDEAQCVL
jgi:hypothetical protein